MMKNAFSFILKALFILKIFKLLSRLFYNAEKQVGQKDQVNFNIYEVATWEKNHYNTLLSNISRVQGNQTTKFGKLIKYNKINIFLQKLYTNCGGEVLARPFSKKSKLNISLNQQSKVLHRLFLVVSKSSAIEIY